MLNFTELLTGYYGVFLKVSPKGLMLKQWPALTWTEDIGLECAE